MTSEANAASYLRFADAYDALAEQQKRLARDIAELKIDVHEEMRRGGSQRILCRTS
jgi:hypothetical protein